MTSMQTAPLPAHRHYPPQRTPDTTIPAESATTAKLPFTFISTGGILPPSADHAARSVVNAVAAAPQLPHHAKRITGIGIVPRRCV
jgi:hypothetical protein